MFEFVGSNGGDGADVRVITSANFCTNVHSTADGGSGGDAIKVSGMMNIPENKTITFVIGANGADRAQEDTSCGSNLYFTHDGTNGGNGTDSSLSIDGSIIYTLTGGNGSSGANKPNGYGATAGTDGSDGSYSTTSDYLTSPVMIFASSTVSSGTPYLRIKY